MRFEMMLGFWKMKDMVKHSSGQRRNNLYEGENIHVVHSIVISNGNMHANIMYRYEENPRGIKSKFAYIYGDIMFSGFPDMTGLGSRVFIKDAKLSDIRRDFVEDLSVP